jgi:hypothetical protein
MLRSGSKTNSAYDVNRDLEYLNLIVYTIMLSVGITKKDIEQTTIDEIIESIRTMFVYSKDKVPTASSDLMRSQNTLLVVNARRAWRDRQTALEVKAHG